MAGQAGYRAAVFVDTFGENNATTLLRAHRWSVDWKIDDFDTTSFINWGVGQYTGGLTDFDLAFDCFWYQADNPHSALTNHIIPGITVSIRIRYAPAMSLAQPNNNVAANTDVPGYFFNRCLVTNCHTETSVRDTIRYNFTARVSAESLFDVAVLQIPGTPLNFGGAVGIGFIKVPS